MAKKSLPSVKTQAKTHLRPNKNLRKSSNLKKSSIPHLTRTLFIAVSLIGFIFIKSCTSETPVTNSPDILSPTFDNCPTSPIVMNVAMGDLDTVVIAFPTPITASDNSSSVTLSVTTIPDSASITIDDTTDSARPTSTGGTFPLGDTTVTLTASDGSPNSQDTICTFTVTVTVNAFGTPTFADTCPTDSSFTLEEVVAGMTTRTWTAPIATIESGNPITLTTNVDPTGSITLLDPPNQEGHNSSFTFNEASTIITYTATDPISNNQATCSFTVTIDELTSREPRFDTCVPTQLFPLGTALIPDEDTPSISFTTEDSTPTTPPTPTTLTIPTDPDTNTATIEWNIPTALTDIDIPLMVDAGAATPTLPINVVDNTMPPRASATFTLGTSVTITYLATDPNGDNPSATLATCSFTITVEDTEPPTINHCPTNYDEPLLDIAVNTDPDSSTALVTWGTSGLTAGTAGSPRPIFAADNSGSVTLTVSSSTLPPGSTTPVENANTVTIDIDDTTDATMPSNANGTFPIGETTVTFTATDSLTVDLTDPTCTFTVTVTDEELPIITNCPNDIDVTLTTGESTFTLSEWDLISSLPIVASDNSDSVTLSFTVSTIPPDATTPVDTSTATITIDDSTDSAMPSSSGGTFPAGVTTVTFTATSHGTPSAPCTFTVTVNDNEDPIIPLSGSPGNCPENTGALLTDQNTLEFTWTAPTATDNVALIPTVITTTIPTPITPIEPANDLGHDTSGTFSIGETLVTYTFTDTSGNEVMCAFSVLVTNLDFPLFTPCERADFTVNGVPLIIASGIKTGQGLPTATVTWDTLTATATPESTSGPADITGPEYFEEDGNTPRTITGNTFPIGTTVVSYTATNTPNGNTTPCAFTITVLDEEEPVFTDPASCPDNAPSISGTNNNPVSWTLAAMDNSGSTLIYEATAPSSSSASINTDFMGGTFPIGDTVVTVEATDPSGNTATCTFTVTIIDTIAPTISCGINDPQNSGTLTTTIDVDATVDITTLSWIVETSDNSGETPTLSSTVMQTSGPTDPQATIHTDHLGGTFPTGTFTVTITAMDISNNMAECLLMITLNDRVPPTISACSASNGPFTATTTNPMITVSWTVTATDNSGITPTSFSYEVVSSDNANVITRRNPADATPSADDITISFPTDDSFEANFPAGEHNIAVTTMDADNNLSEPCEFTITVTDGIPPTLVCPTMELSMDATTEGLITVSWTGMLTANDNLDPTVTISYVVTLPDNSPSISILTNALTAGFPIGVHTIAVTATDDTGNNTDINGMATCTFTVTINDKVAPTLFCPADVMTSGTAGSMIPVTWDPANASDNFDTTLMVTYSAPMAANVLPTAIDKQTTTSATFIVPTGAVPNMTTITASVSDAAGNSAMDCTFTVTVTDEAIIPPIFTSCPVDRTVTASTFNNIHLQWDIPTATAGEGGAPVSVGLPTATNISDPDNPTPITMMDNNPFMDDFMFDPDFEPEGSSYGNGYDYDGRNFGRFHGNTFEPGVYRITYTVSNDAGSDTCSFTYTIIESGQPLFTRDCPASITAVVPNANDTIPLAWSQPIAVTISHDGEMFGAANRPATLTVTNDNSLAIEIGTPSARFPIGTHTITYTATGPMEDLLTINCNFTVTVTVNPNAPAVPREGLLFFLSDNDQTEAPSEANPFLIHNAVDLSVLATAVNSGLSYTNGSDTNMYTEAHYRLESNITLEGSNNFIPIGTTGNSRFQGTFDGNSKSITGMHHEADTSSAVGLFGNILNATINNLTLSNATITNNNAPNIGALVGSVNGTSSKLDKVFISGGSITGANVLNANLGGIVGNNEGALTRSFSSAQINAVGRASNSVGGAVGRNSGIITRVAATGNVSSLTAEPSGFALNYGGLVGRNNGEARITASAAFGKMTINVGGSSNLIGGLVGFNNTTNHITASYSGGNITVTVTTQDDTSRAGGFIGFHSNNTAGEFTAEIINSYSSGQVSGTFRMANNRGFIGGTSSRGVPTYSYWVTDGNPTEQDIVNAIGLSAAKLQQPTAYTTEVTGVPITLANGRYGGTPTSYAIYTNWSNTLTLTGIDDGSGSDETTSDPWDFGEATDFPALKGLIMGLNEDGSDIPFTPADQRNQ